MDETQGGYIATEHLIGLGHTRLGAIFPKVIRDSIQRKKGFSHAHEIHGSPVHSEWLLENEEGLQSKIDHFLDKKNGMTGLVCYHDGIAARVIRILNKIGLNVPQDISVVGYDDSLGAGDMDVALTTVSHPKDKMAMLAAKKLIELIRGQGNWPFQFVYQPQLVERRSTAKP
jgi:GntR family transcriptional regulator of arabinose operon